MPSDDTLMLMATVADLKSEAMEIKDLLREILNEISLLRGELASE